MAVSLSCAVPEPLKPPVGIRPRLSTVVWAMVMGENEEVGCLWFVECELWFVVCGLWFVACGLWCVLSNPDPPIADWCCAVEPGCWSRLS